MPKVKSAVIGTGEISAEHLKFLANAKTTQLVGVCDLSRAAARYAAKTFGADNDYTDYKQMLDDAKPDVVHVLTPPQSHVPITTDCLDAGAHVICEKPITLGHEQFTSLYNHAQQKQKRLIEDHNYRFNKPILKIEKLIADGTLGDVLEVDIRMALNIRGAGGRFADTNLPNPAHKLPAGVIHDFITHLSYLALRFIPDPDKVRAAWTNHQGDDLFKYDDLDALLIAGNKHARIRFSCRTQPDCFAITVRGTRAEVQTDLFHPFMRLIKPRTGGEKLAPVVNQLANGLSLVGSSLGTLRNKLMQRSPYEGLHTLLNQTYIALKNDAEPPVTFDDMDRASRLIDQMLAGENRI
jgi:predicted dehydrogenase